MGKWRERSKQALKETRRALWIETGEHVVIAIFLAAIYVLLAYAILGEQAGRGEFTLKMLLWAAPVVAFPAVFAWKLLDQSVDFRSLVRGRRLNLTIAITLSVAAIAAWGWFAYIQLRVPIEWGDQFGLIIEGQLKGREAPIELLIAGFSFGGHNRLDRTIYQVDASITLDRTKHVFPLYITSAGQWILLSQARGLPPEVPFTIGCQMRGDTLHCGAMTERMSPARFLRDVGPFVFTVTLDGKTWSYSFSMSKLEQQIEAKRSELQTQLTRLLQREIERAP